MSTKKEIQISTVQKFKDLCDCLHLVHQQYSQAGWIEEKSSKLHFSITDLLPNSVTFIAKKDTEICGTVRAIVGPYNLLPATPIFENDFSEMELDSQIVAEGT